MWPRSSASIRAVLVHQRAPRGVDQDHARLGMRARRFASRRPRVSSLSARWSEITSARASRSSRATSGTPASGRGERFQAITSIPMPRAIRATSRPMPPEPDQAERLAVELHAFERLPHARAHCAVHAREPAAAGEDQRHGVLGDRNVAIALDGVHGDAEAGQRRNVHVARGAGAEKNDVLELAAFGHDLGRHVGMVVEADVVAGQEPRQIGGLECIGVDRDRRVVGVFARGQTPGRADCCSR